MTEKSFPHQTKTNPKSGAASGARQGQDKQQTVRLIMLEETVTAVVEREVTQVEEMVEMGVGDMKDKALERTLERIR